MWRDFHYNHHSLKNRRQQLRNRATESEQIIWQKLKSNKLGYKFIRQYSITGYVLDFFCPQLRIGIEIDGSIHDNLDQIQYDEFRNKYLKAFDIKIIHIKNSEIFQDLDEAIKKIRAALPS